MKKTFLPFAIALFLMVSCNNTGNQRDFASEYDGELEQAELSQPTYQYDEAPPPQLRSTPQNQPTQGQEEEAPVPRQIIKTANYRIQVKDLDVSSKHAAELATKHGGYVSQSTLNNSNYEISNELTIRVPANRFDSLLSDLGGEAIFTKYMRIQSEDVTRQYVDATTRLKTKKEVRDRYVEILRNKARTAEEILKAEEQIGIVQEEIEAKEAELRFLKDQVAMSTIMLELYQAIEYRPEPSAFHESFWSKLKTSLQDGWGLAQGLVLFFFNIWPIVILAIVIWWKRRWIGSKLRRK